MSGPEAFSAQEKDRDARIRQTATRELARHLSSRIHSKICLRPAVQKLIKEQAWRHERLLDDGRRIAPMSLDDFVTAYEPIGLCSSFDQIEEAIQHDEDTLSIWLHARGGVVASKRRLEALRHEGAAFQIAHALFDHLPADALATVRGALRSTTAEHISMALVGLVGDDAAALAEVHGLGGAT